MGVAEVAADSALPLAQRGQFAYCLVSHYYLFTTQELVTTYGLPFIVILHRGETLGQFKARIYERLQNKYSPEEFAKFKFAAMPMLAHRSDKPKYFESDDDVVGDFENLNFGHFQGRMFFGLEHVED